MVIKYNNLKDKKKYDDKVTIQDINVTHTLDQYIDKMTLIKGYVQQTLT